MINCNANKLKEPFGLIFPLAQRFLEKRNVARSKYKVVLLVVEDYTGWVVY